jgi:hypothetical protein
MKMKKMILIMMTFAISSAAMAFDVDRSEVKSAAVKLEGTVVELPNGIVNIFDLGIKINNETYPFSEASYKMICNVYGYKEYSSYTVRKEFKVFAELANDGLGVFKPDSWVSILASVSCKK